MSDRLGNIERDALIHRLYDAFEDGGIYGPDRDMVEGVYEDAIEPLRRQLEGAVEELRQLRGGVQCVLDLRSSYEADRGNDVPLVGNLQAREMLERLARGQ